MIPSPLSTWAAPEPLQYGAVVISAFALVYLCGVRQVLGRKTVNDVAVALAITTAAAFVGFLVLAMVSFSTVLGYAYGIVMGAALARLVGKYDRVS